MSWQAVKAVLEHSRARLSERLVLIVIAEASDADGSGCKRGKASIGNRAGVGRTAVTDAIQALARAGELVVELRPGKASRYQIVLPTLGIVPAPATVSRPDFGPLSDTRAADTRPPVRPRLLHESEPELQGTLIGGDGEIDEWTAAAVRRVEPEPDWSRMKANIHRRRSGAD